MNACYPGNSTSISAKLLVVPDEYSGAVDALSRRELISFDIAKMH